MAKKIKLSRDRVASVNAALREAHDLQPDIALLEECGDDCTEYRETLEQVVAQLTALKERFA